ncbi:histidinol-phosphate transaminase [Enterovibrio baiacu]|uniref:Histidinol-phosphate aminotransferase n=1 Tax=Enterovibrio norvegicus TaxID=188144 RepID=A0A2N7L5A3_9GAMM|nr:histidinol-phosphate transaminase [Enterovibrio baiacu]MBE1274941.1 histidinol-phosphate transaminase [Enterovibrio baiacu]PML80982.1 histidinol-phosphate transaminase [Enterovibrio norvegicus]PMN88793.1 histidinol-phosphate transaminase [Enterovibrio norvegicus]
MDIEKLARKDVQALTPYLSARRLGGQGDVWLNANESPFNNEYVVSGNSLNRYSECQPDPLIRAYADYAGVRPDQVLTSRGADESIELLIRTFCEAGEDSILFCPPTYGMYAISAETFGVSRKTVPLTEDWQLNMPEIEKQIDGVKLVFVCSPNNPTGNLLNRNDIEALLEMTAGKALVVVDEAYIDFCPEASTVDLLVRYPNLAILRTMSKAFALAGLRCGFTLANTQVIQLMLKVIAPYPVPVPVTEIACQALSEVGLARMKYQVLDLNANRAYLQAGLSMLPGVQVFDGYGNYLLVKFDDADLLFSTLWDNGIILRRSPIEGCIRISVGNREECEKTLTFIRQQLA